MRRIVYTLLVLFCGMFVYGQDLEQHDKKYIPAEAGNTSKIEAQYFHFPKPQFMTRIGPLDYRRYMIPANFTAITLSEKKDADQINFLAASKAEAQYKKSFILSNRFMAGQVKQIRTQMQIFNKNREGWGNPDGVHFQSRFSPRNNTFGNEAYDGMIHRPFYYNNPYRTYNPLYYRSYYNPLGGFYRYRR